MTLRRGKKRTAVALILVISLVVLLSASPRLLSFLGRFLVADSDPVSADAVVVLNTGMAYFPRLMEAAALYREGHVETVVINGNRKTEALRALEKMGFTPCCPWYEERVRILELLGVARKDVVTVSAENVYDTISEARAVGEELRGRGMSRLIITTSKSHTRRARYIWRKTWPEEYTLITVDARNDPYSPTGWWKEGRQIKWVLSEYGAWLYLHWHYLRGA